ncbi:DedA family protein [Acidiphilium angustum]|uniref:Membrane protein DedA, SNARE-associated domain n=2 Tax=Acidiphilium rubrum TaxID=526 RepID=A0A8G2CL54_ACIRU|nr:DedA family protein [Acidiphilium angustum]SIQ93859.1 membrane protein DedA, SNARE-associated domain [Acidiphilium rubrum]
MLHFFHHAMEPWIAAYGSVAVALLILLESLGLPLPGETALVSAAIYAGTTHRIDIFILIASAALGAIIGGVLGYWIGRRAGYPTILRHGSRIGLTERRLLAGRWLFANHGGKIVVFGRFFAVLRALAALIAGVTMMDWRRFVVFQSIASILWATLYGGAAYVFGKQIEHVAGPIGVAIAVAIGIAVVVTILLFHRHGDRLERIAAARARREQS